MTKMRILVADDDVSIRRLLATLMTDWGYEAVVGADGNEAWSVMSAENAPLVAIMDWSMPGMTGPEVIRNVRATPHYIQPYILLLTARDRQSDIVEGLRAGASDYIIKPFDHDELQARLQTGAQMIGLQCDLSQRVYELQEALEHVKRLQELLPICSYCRKVRDDQNYWRGVEDYLSRNAEVNFTHCVCPDCYRRVVRPEIDGLKTRNNPS